MAEGKVKRPKRRGHRGIRRASALWKTRLAAGGTGQELAQADEIGIGVFVDPLPAHDAFFAEIPDVGDRPAEAGDAKLWKDSQHFKRRASLSAFVRSRVGD